MEANIIKRIEAILGNNDSLQKINPNTQSPVSDQSISVDDAIVPAILAGFYKKTRDEAGANELLTQTSNNTFDIIFGDQKDNIVKSVANYAGTSESNAFTQMHQAADAIHKYVVGNLKHQDAASLMNYFTSQRTKILTQLPADLKMGELLNDSTIDDKTNKMEGPMSGLMHGIEKLFSSSK